MTPVIQKFIQIMQKSPAEICYTCHCQDNLVPQFSFLYGWDRRPGGKQSASPGRSPGSQPNPRRCRKVSLRHGYDNYLLVGSLIKKKKNIDTEQVHEYPYNFNLIMTIFTLFKKRKSPQTSPRTTNYSKT